MNLDPGLIFHALGSWLLSLIVSAISAPFVFKLLVKLKSRQTISEHVPEHAAKQGTPTMGGIIIMIGLIAGLLTLPIKEAAGPLLLVLTFGAIGFVDDFVVPRLMKGKRGLGWKQKLILEIAACLGAVVLGGQALNWTVAVAVFSILFFSNAYNFSDGLDGLAGSLGILLAVGLAILSMLFAPSGATIVTMSALFGAIIPFLFLNAPPARVFMGDVGALPIGAVIGLAFYHLISVPTKVSAAFLWLSLAVLGLVMVIELVPVPLQILSVNLRKGKRLFPRTPIHHAFQHAGWPETRVVGMFVLVQLVCVGIAVGLAVAGWVGGTGPSGSKEGSTFSPLLSFGSWGAK